MSTKQPDFPAVGVDQRSLPEGLIDPHADDSSWWPSRKTIPGPNNGDSDSAAKKPWRSTAGEEMENFKPIPVVGRLPWRSQYMVFSLILMVSLAALLYFASASLSGTSTIQANAAAETTLRKSLAILRTHVNDVTSGRPAPLERFTWAVNQADQSSAVFGGDIAKEWTEIKPLLQAVSQQSPDAQAVISSAAQARVKLGEGLLAVAPLWRQAGNNGEWDSVDAVNLSQVIAEMQSLYDITDRITEDKSKFTDRLSTSRQNIEQAFRVFAASEASNSPTTINQAWRAAATGFLAARPHLEILIGRQKQWDTIRGAKDVFTDRERAMLDRLDQASDLTPTTSLQNGLWLSGSVVLLSLVFLIWVSWKQQRWHILEALANSESMELGIQEISRQLRPAASGNLTARLKSPSPTLRPLSDTLNTTFRSIHGLVENVKKTAENTADAAAKATDATGILVETTRAQTAAQVESGQDIIAIAAAVQQVSALSQDASQVSAETLSSIVVGQQAVEDARARIQTIRNKAQEGADRSRRLKQSSSEILFAATLLNDVAEQMSVLSIQASLQAVKAGEAGVGFRVVADGLKSLSERSGEGARRVGSLIEATINDVEAMEEAMLLVTNETDEGSRLSDISMESTLAVSERIQQLMELIESIRATSTQQARSSEILGVRTQQSLQHTEESISRAQDAAEAVVSLVEAVRALAQSSLKFKV